MEATCCSRRQSKIQIHWQFPFFPKNLLNLFTFAPWDQLVRKHCAIIIIIWEVSSALELVNSIFKAIVGVHHHFPWIIEAIVASKHHAWCTIEIQLFDIISMDSHFIFELMHSCKYQYHVKELSWYRSQHTISSLRPSLGIGFHIFRCFFLKGMIHFIF